MRLLNFCQFLSAFLVRTATPNGTFPHPAPSFPRCSPGQKHVTHDEAPTTLDAIVHLIDVDRKRTTPPTSPIDGQRQIIAADASVACAGQSDQVAAFQDGAWAFYVPRQGWLARIEAEGMLLVDRSSEWKVASATNPASLVGVNATADVAKGLSVSSPNTLLNREGSDHRMNTDNATATNTASTIF